MTTSAVLSIALAVSLTLSTILVVVLAKPLRLARPRIPPTTAHPASNDFRYEVNRG